MAQLNCLSPVHPPSSSCRTFKRGRRWVCLPHTDRGHGSRLLNAIADTSESEVTGLSMWSDLTALDTFLESAGWGKSDRTRTLESPDLTLTQHRWVTSLRDSPSESEGL